MKKAKYLKTICCPMTDQMFLKVQKITDEKEISFSEFLRESVELKLQMEEAENGREKTV